MTQWRYIAFLATGGQKSIVKFSKRWKISNEIKNTHKINHVECEKLSISDFINFFYFLSFHCFFEATNLKFCSKMDSNWSIAISFWYLWTWKFCFWSRIYPRQLVMTKKCPKSRLGGKNCQICATLAKSPYVLVSLLYKDYLL